MRRTPLILIVAVCGLASCSSDAPLGPSPQTPFTFFVTSTTSTTGNLGGIQAADAMCQRLATAVGHGRRVWRAYLSVEADYDNGNRASDARSRIGQGPWFNINGDRVAANLTELHDPTQRRGDANVFLDENGQKINGQWTGSPTPNQHDILTGSNADGTLIAGGTCADWTSSSATLRATVGHSDGFGPQQSTAGTLSSWNNAHVMSNSCANTAPGGGAGRVYCFARE
jgi:hypothetical protein